MAHYKSYDSFKTKRSVEKKNRAKKKSEKQNNDIKDSVIDNTDDYGTVIAVRYDDAYVLYNNEVVLTKIRPDLNLICNKVLFPGDKVVLQYKSDAICIYHRLARKTLLSRVKKDSTRLDESVGLTKNIAANIECAVIVVAAKEPPLHERFIDRYLMILQDNGIDAIICLNKCELATDEVQRLEIYRDIGIPMIETSARKMIGIDQLKNYIRGKQTILVGNSGVGKSSLINAIMQQDEIKTSSVSEKSKKGCHTTTASKYYIWDSESSIIDTPGIRSLDVSSFNVNEIQDYFPEFNDWKTLCKYKNCLHYNEPYKSCMVKQGVRGGMINKTRYDSYVRIIGDITNQVFNDDIEQHSESEKY